MLAAQSRAELESVLDDAGRPVTLHDGDCFAVLARPGAVPGPVGVYFYDGAHTGLAHYLALGVVEPLLADEAVVLVDDASWPMVAAATRRYLDRHPGWSVLRDIRAAADHDERWANGLLVLRYRRPPGTAAAMAADVRWRRLVQVHARGPATRWSGARCTASRGWSRWPSGRSRRDPGPSRSAERGRVQRPGRELPSCSRAGPGPATRPGAGRAAPARPRRRRARSCRPG